MSASSSGRLSRFRKGVLALASIYPAMLLGLSAVHVFFPQRNGPLALTQVFAPYLFLPLLLLLPLLFVRGSLVFRLLFVACVLIFAARFLPRISLSHPEANPDAPRLRVMSWNMRVNNRRMGEATDFLRTKPADVVALLEPDWGWYFDLNNNKTLDSVYPYRRGSLLRDEQSGVVLLSAYPILEEGVIGILSGDTPPGGQPVRPEPLRSQWARLDMGQGRTVTVVAVHAYPPSPPIRPCPSPGPLCYDASRRDAQLVAISGFVGQILKRGEPLILAGDFNVTDREPGYRDLASGLRDAQLEAGSGTGNTWRPDFLLNRELPILRIDYQFSSPNVRPLLASTDCTLRGSDHCVVYGTFELGR